MEAKLLGASSPFSEGDNPILDPDLYDADTFDFPDPGLLTEKNELSFMEPSQFLPLFTSSQWWQTRTPSARARQLWLLLRAGLHDIVEKEKKAELHVARLTHGLEPLRRLEVAAGLRSVAQDPVGRRFVVLDGAGLLHLHREDGWAQEKLPAPVALTGLVAVLGPLGTVGRFVGWGPAGLAILGPNFNLLWLSEPGEGLALGCEPTCCLPVPDQGLLLVAQMGGSLVLWKFRSGGHRLVLCGSPLQPPPSPVGELKRLALGPAPPDEAPRCFAAYGSAVLTFNLQAWALVDVRRDLHKTTISDLAYCKEVEAMVTASRDSTVKVWEADWQIRMVFVGHTGPVTALAVLPNTTLVLSASHDGTLRTWDLQAAAQVGEVALCSWGQDALSGRVRHLLAPMGPGWPVLSLCTSAVELWRVRELYSPLAQLPAPVLHLQVVPPLPALVYPRLPTRLVCACADGSVCLLSAATGRTVSVLLLEPDDCAAAVAYCLPREALWLLTHAGHLVRANAARCPMLVLHRVCPLPPPAPQPCCLHLYSHLADPSSAFTSWEIVRQHRGELHRSTMAWAWKDKNRYLPVVGHTDGSLSVLEWVSSKTVFHTVAHSPGPVTAIASTWNSIMSSGGDLTVKMWRVFPYAEESLSLLRTFSCCHPVVTLCVLGKRVTVGFEDPDSATYGLVQFSLGDSQRFDHRPQDDPMDHITGLCCCPSLRLYACSSLDCTIRIWTAENRLLRLLQLNGAPQALAFCNNSGDLVLALGSRLCLVSHRLYLPTSYLVKKLCWKAPDMVDDPPLPVTSQESLTSAQLQRLANLHGAASLSAALSFIHETAPTQQPVVKEDLEALVARDRDLKQLRLGLVVPADQPPLSWQQRQEAFNKYLHLIYGSGVLSVQSRRESWQWNTGTLTMEREIWDMCALPRAGPCLCQAGVSTEAQSTPTALPPQDLRVLGQRFARPPRITLPIPPISRKVHSRASQLLACSSLSDDLGLSLDLQLQWERLQERTTMALDPPSSHLQHRIPLLQKRRPKEPPSNLRGFFPATTQPYKLCPRPISFPGCVPNSVVLQRMWLPAEIGHTRSLAQLTSQRGRKTGVSQYDLWLQRHSKRFHTPWERNFTQWLGEEEEEEDEEWEEELDLEADWALASLSSETSQAIQQLDSCKQGGIETSVDLEHPYEATRTKTSLHPEYQRRRLPWEECFRHLPKFLHFFVCQHWFKKLFPIFTLEAYPEMGTVEGLASLLMGLLKEATWVDRVHILRALLRLLPDVSSTFRGRLQSTLVQLLNLDQPPSLQDWIQRQFVMLALRLLLACSLDSQDVVLELMSYFLYSPASCQPELRKMLDGLGLQDPEGFLFKEMLTWVLGRDFNSKAALRRRCCQKLEDLIQQLQVETLQPPSAAQLSAELPKVSDGTSKPFSPKKTTSQASVASLTPSGTSWPTSNRSKRLLQTLEMPLLVISPTQPDLAALQLQTKRVLAQMHIQHTQRVLSDTLQSFPSVPDTDLYSVPTLPVGPPPLEKADWSKLQILDLGLIDTLNLFCKQQRARQHSLIPEAELPPLMVPNTVVAPTQDHWHHPILRLQEASVQKSGMRLRGEWRWGQRLTWPHSCPPPHCIAHPRPDAVPCWPHPGWLHPDVEAAAATSGGAAFPPGLAQACPLTAPAAPTACPTALLCAR
ncbi:WD repeat-containing protein 97 isoform X2 [Lemur catta]|uniref:WD repeat-containing protein 97 isoform X2 n=1 Tax=Lemur catta TaxID=9447 RepID=UPI001E267336|nr:WD repeat-containing protein 97 isoform X2 [Lemur catta]